jgi:hypothetical protein
MAKQINIFIENRPGRLESITGILSENNINIRAFTIQDRGDFGLIKLIVDKPQQAHLILADRGLACALKDVLAISIPDKPGNLHRLTKILSQQNVNIVDTYGFVLEPGSKGVCCLEIQTDDDRFSRLQDLLAEEGFEILEDQQLYEL